MTKMGSSCTFLRSLTDSTSLVKTELLNLHMMNKHKEYSVSYLYINHLQSKFQLKK
jgi:hypothetical protein